MHVDPETSAGRGTGVGALGGTGVGAAAAPVLCAASGFLFPICLVAVVSSGAGIGAATGAVVGANIKESAAERQSKLDLVMSQVAATSNSTALTTRLQRMAAEQNLEWSSTASDGTAGADPRSVGASRWTVEVAVIDVTTSGKTRFQLEIEARVRLLRAGELRPVFERTYREDTDAELTLAQWSADEARVVDRETGAVLDVIARQIVRDLTRADAAEYEAWQRRRARVVWATN